MNKTWNMIRKINGKNSKAKVQRLNDGLDLLTSKSNISNKLPKTSQTSATILFPMYLNTT